MARSEPVLATLLVRGRRRAVAREERQPTGVDGPSSQHMRRTDGEADASGGASHRAGRAGQAAATDSRPNRGRLPTGTPASDFTSPDSADALQPLQEFRVGWVVLVLSNPCCGPCQALAPELVDFCRRPRGNNLEVMMVSRCDPEADRAEAKEHGFAFAVETTRHREGGAGRDGRRWTRADRLPRQQRATAAADRGSRPAWMDATKQRFAYCCLPLLIANQAVLFEAMQARIRARPQFSLPATAARKSPTRPRTERLRAAGADSCDPNATGATMKRTTRNPGHL